MGFLRTFAKPPKRKVKILRPCRCGYHGVSGTRWDDIVHCNGCGQMYYIDSTVKDRIAKIEWKDEED